MIALWEKKIPGYNPALSKEKPALTPFLPLKRKAPSAAIIVCPGGAYERRAEHEGTPVAEWLSKLGIAVFLLDYRVAPYRHPWPLCDAQRAIRLIRHRAAEWQIDPSRIGILGFSAGGHLAATAATASEIVNLQADDPIDQERSHPDALILGYPVISLLKMTHPGSLHNLLGETPDPELTHKLSAHLQVTSTAPPTFLWHTAADAGVPVENSLWFAEALSKNKVPFEMHIFQKGRHGLGIKDEVPEVLAWKDLCATWLRGIGFLP
jgi:acetyl esterase/lipase